MTASIDEASRGKAARGRISRVDFDIRIGRASHRVYFQSGDCDLKRSNEARVAAALLPCMKTGNACPAGGLLSQRFIAALDSIQDYFAAWKPELSRVPVIYWGPRKNKKTGDTARVGAFFTGGVDSFYTLLKHRDVITDLVFVHGFDIRLDEVSLWRRAAESVQGVAAAFGKNLILVETDLRAFTNQYVRWSVAHGAALAAVGHLLAGIMPKIYIPASLTYDDPTPWGSHPRLDRLWSTEAFEFVDDGTEASRVQKVGVIAQHDIALNLLRVCLKNPYSAYNCGECEKCLRTMINLRIAGALGRCKTLPGTIDLEKVRSIVISKVINRNFIRENLRALEEKQIDPALAEALRAVLNG